MIRYLTEDTAKNQITFYRLYQLSKYWNTKCILFLSVPAYLQNMVAYVVNMFIIRDDRQLIQAIRGQGGGEYSVISINPDISRV